jgi:hypothetical protein
VAIFLWSAQRFGVPVDRIAVTLWILGAFAFANVGKPLRAQRNMLRDWSVYAAMLFGYEYSRGLADQLGVPVHRTLVRDIDRAMFFGTDPNVWMQHHFQTLVVRVSACSYIYDALHFANGRRRVVVVGQS